MSIEEGRDLPDHRKQSKKGLNYSIKSEWHPWQEYLDVELLANDYLHTLY